METVNEQAKYCENSIKKTPTPMPDISKKTKMSVWFAKDCAITAGAKLRLKLIKDLVSKGLEVGGNSKCLNSAAKDVFMTMTNMFDIIASHKFYLAFENSYHCSNYITEKVWLNAFYVGTVPVVWGASKEDYMRMAPKKSFIHYEDFNNSQELVDYLKYLDKNDIAYMEYFEWRKSYPCDYPLYEVHDEEYPFSTESEYTVFYNTNCNLCKMLQKVTVKPRTISSLKNYWFDGETEECLI